MYRCKLALNCIVICIVISYFALESLNKQSGQHVHSHFGNTTMLVIAHPDDESMFFGPTILNLLANNKSLVILCLSNGNAYNYGQQREQELAQVARTLGPLVSLGIVEDSDLGDGMTEEWDTFRIVNHIEKHIKGHADQIQTLVTFDSYGVSGHTNHQSIYKALMHLRNNSKDLQVNFLVLKSVPFWRKYTLFVDSIMTTISLYGQNMNDKSQATITLSLDFSGYIALRKLLELHRTQMVWFRQLYMMFSRYMFINDLEPLI